MRARIFISRGSSSARTSSRWRAGWRRSSGSRTSASSWGTTSVSWSGFDGLYFYNPFAENVYSHDEHLDDTVELSGRRFLRDVRHATVALHAAPVDTCMITYNGLGGPIPSSYQLVHEEPVRCDWFRVWVKHEQEVKPGTFYLEGNDEVSLVSAATVARNARKRPLV